MPTPAGWRGSDGQARAEVVLWLKQHGGRYEQSDGLIVSRMRNELGKGRALSQLLADMDADGMIRREVRGRRTFSIDLLDDKGFDLGSRPVFRPPSNSPQPVGSNTDDSLQAVDYDDLAAVLLKRVIDQAHAVPSQGAELERLREKVAQLTNERNEARTALSEAMTEASEQREQAEAMRRNLIDFEAAASKPKRGGAALRETLSPKSRQLLDRLMREAPGH